MINLEEYKGRQAAIAAAPSPTTRDELIVKYMPLVRYVVNRLALSLPPMLDVDDVMSYGTMGLIDAIDRFDAERAVKFETYAVTRIRGYIIDQLRAKQTGPVDLLNTVGSTVNNTEAVWLNWMKDQGGAIDLEGLALSQDAVANLITNLQKTGYFKNVEIKETFQDAQVKEVQAFLFTLSCQKAKS